MFCDLRILLPLLFATTVVTPCFSVPSQQAGSSSTVLDELLESIKRIRPSVSSIPPANLFSLDAEGDQLTEIGNFRLASQKYWESIIWEYDSSRSFLTLLKMLQCYGSMREAEEGFVFLSRQLLQSGLDADREFGLVFLQEALNINGDSVGARKLINENKFVCRPSEFGYRCSKDYVVESVGEPVDESILSKYGEAQIVEGSELEKETTWQRIKLVEKYMENLPSESRSHDNCHNSYGLCSFWASIGECESNATFMQDACGPVCFSCDRKESVTDEL